MHSTLVHIPSAGNDGSSNENSLKKGWYRPPEGLPIPASFHFKEQVKKDLDRDVNLGIIEPVPQGEVGESCSRMVITPKASGKPRRTVRLT